MLGHLDYLRRLYEYSLEDHLIGKEIIEDSDNARSERKGPGSKHRRF